VPYISSINGEFVFDDVPLLVEVPFYQEVHPFTDCWKRYYWKDGWQGLYLPFTIFSYLVNVKTAGMYSLPFRAVNLSLYMLTVFIVFKLALRLELGRVSAFIDVVIFVVHPMFYNIKLGNFDSAEKDLQKLISMGTPNPEVYNKLGAMLANRGKYAEALKLWEISLKLDGKQTIIRSAVNDLQNEINLEEKKNDIQR
jgi:tetratricopeptide (TPR) repeat protein